MTKISAKIIADSKNTFGERVTTMVVTFPRFILAELNTHRMFSRNSASSRAIPFKKMVEAVQENPFIPIAWQKDHKGMQGNEYVNWFKECKVWNSHLTDFEILNIKDAWLDARDKMVEVAKNLNESEVTKQLCNRLLEPFMWHTVIITATEWENFFALRCPQYYFEQDGSFRSKKELLSMYKDSNMDYATEEQWLTCNKGQAEIHMMALAEAMWDAYNESKPKQLQPGEWHTPFIEIEEEMLLPIKDLLKISTARCARISYTIVGEEGKKPSAEKDAELHDGLARSGHWSPFEHCAKAMDEKEYYNSVCSSNINNDFEIIDKGVLINTGFVNTDELGWSGNFKGFVQYRKMFNNENITK